MIAIRGGSPSKLVLLSIVVWFNFAIPCRGLETGAIRGMVVDSVGQPVAGATVYALPSNAPPGPQVTHSAETDALGRYDIRGLTWGKYIIVADKPESGYPNTRLAFYSNLKATTLVVGSSNLVVDTTIRLPPKAGWLDLRVVDATAGKELRSAVVTLRRVENPQLFITLSSTVPRIAIPANTGIRVEISAPHYRNQPPFLIYLRPEEEKKMRIALKQ